MSNIEVYHVVPIDDVIEHTENITCQCQPKLNYKDLANGNEVIVHNAIDGREGHSN